MSVNQKTVEALVAFAKNSKLLSLVDRTDLLRLAEHARVQDMATGAVIVKQGDPGETFYLMVDGEVSVFVFFGLFGTLGTTFVQHGAITAESIWASLAVGSLTTALLVANNLRDIPTDAVSGKRTLAVRIGEGGTRAAYSVAVAVPTFTIAEHWPASA